MDRCRARKANGERCGGRAIEGSGWCWNHDPTYAEARRRNAAKGGKRGGRGRPLSELGELKTLLAELTEKVLADELPTGPAAVANQLTNTRLRAIEVERRIKETDDLEARLEVLERQLGKRGPRWGA